MKKTLITATLFLACSGVFAQALSEKDVQEIQSSFKKRNFQKVHIRHQRQCPEPRPARKSRPLFQVPDRCERHYQSAQLRTMLDVYFDERITPIDHEKIQPQPIRFFTQLPVLLGYFREVESFPRKYYRNEQATDG